MSDNIDSMRLVMKNSVFATPSLERILLVNAVFTVFFVAMIRFQEFPIEPLSVIDLFFAIGGLIFWIGCSYFVKLSSGFQISEEGVGGNLFFLKKKITWEENLYYKKSFLSILVYRNHNVMPSMILPNSWMVSNLPEIRKLLIEYTSSGESKYSGRLMQLLKGAYGSGISGDMN